MTTQHVDPASHKEKPKWSFLHFFCIIEQIYRNRSKSDTKMHNNAI